MRFEGNHEKMPFGALAIILPCICHSQTGPVLVTNWFQPTADYKIVDGKLYNTRYSTNWTDISQGVSRTITDGFFDHLEASDFYGDHMVCDVYVNRIMDSPPELIKRIAIRNASPLVYSTGSRIPNDLRVMRVANESIGQPSI